MSDINTFIAFKNVVKMMGMRGYDISEYADIKDLSLNEFKNKIMEDRQTNIQKFITSLGKHIFRSLCSFMLEINQKIVKVDGEILKIDGKANNAILYINDRTVEIRGDIIKVDGIQVNDIDIIRQKAVIYFSSNDINEYQNTPVSEIKIFSRIILNFTDSYDDYKKECIFIYPSELTSDAEKNLETLKNTTSYNIQIFSEDFLLYDPLKCERLCNVRLLSKKESEALLKTNNILRNQLAKQPHNEIIAKYLNANIGQIIEYIRIEEIPNTIAKSLMYYRIVSPDVDNKLISARKTKKT